MLMDVCSTYPGQSGINPLPMDWGNADPQKRGPVVVTRSQTTIRRRNGKFGSSLMAGMCTNWYSYWR